MVLAAGATKRPILEQVRAGANYPIAQVTSGAGETWWLVDRDAAPGN
jgi:gluconokinase/6-phosphogluconolactonase